jgi:DNA replication regulator SLD2
MEDKEREALTEKLNALRVELKIWERNFASANNGVKASRDDIKKNPDIGASSKFPRVRRANVDNCPSWEV